MPNPAHKRQLTSTVFATLLMTPTTALGLSIRLSFFELREIVIRLVQWLGWVFENKERKKESETGDWDIFLGPPERARAATGGADQWVLKRRELPGFAIVNEIKTPASLGYPPSVFNKSSTLKFYTTLSVQKKKRIKGGFLKKQTNKQTNKRTISQSSTNIQLHHYCCPVIRLVLRDPRKKNKNTTYNLHS